MFKLSVINGRYDNRGMYGRMDVENRKVNINFYSVHLANHSLIRLVNIRLNFLSLYISQAFFLRLLREWL